MSFEIHAAYGRHETIAEIGLLARIAEESGFTHVSLPDQPALNRDVWVGLAAAAQATSRIGIGAGVTDPSTYHPMLIANATASLDELSNGRAFAGIGAGGRFGKDMDPLPLADLREAVAFIKDFMTGAEATYKGVQLHSEWIRRPVPLYMAIDGPRSHAIAGEFADGVYVQSVHPTVIKWRLELLDKAATQSGRALSDIALLPSTNVFLADSKDEARREVATQTAGKLKFHYALWRNSPESLDLRNRLDRSDPGLLDEMKNVKEIVDRIYDEERGTIDYHHEQIDAPYAKPVTDRIIDYFQLVGTADEIYARLEELRRLGIGGILALMYTFEDRRGMLREIGEKLIPRLIDQRDSTYAAPTREG